ncbi:MAG: hypothetical protein R8J41_00385 [Alphaproteobacteria bacterium]|nr:hypothetical protein [Alphaproteobacteria bacterium]
MSLTTAMMNFCSRHLAVLLGSICTCLGSVHATELVALSDASGDDCRSAPPRGAITLCTEHIEKLEKKGSDQSRGSKEYASQLYAAYIQRGISFGRLAEYQSAVADFNSAIGIKPDGGSAYANRGVAHRLQGAFEKSIEDFGKAIILEPENPNHFANRGISNYKAKWVGRAFEDLEKAVELSPAPYFLTTLAWHRYLSGNVVAAKELSDRSIAQGKSYLSSVTHAHILAALGEEKLAYREFVIAANLGGFQKVREMQKSLHRLGLVRARFNEALFMSGDLDDETKDGLWKCALERCRLLDRVAEWK